MSLLLHELATNAVKYGALSVPEGLVRISWSRHEGMLQMGWSESGGPAVAEPSRIGLGTRLIDMGLVGTGSVVKCYAPSGFSVKFSAPLRLIEFAGRIAAMILKPVVLVVEDEPLLL